MSFNRKELKVTERSNKKTNPFAKDIVVDPRGLWDNPGPVRIPGNNITTQGMQGNVMAYPQGGSPTVMTPDNMYSFGNADYVDEVPMFNCGGKYKMQDGGRKLAFNSSLAKDNKEFQAWYKENTLEGQNGVPYSDDLSYDYYSYFMNNEKGGNPEDHFVDTYKRPTHPTFSNESIYSIPENPGGEWIKSLSGEDTYSPSGPFLNEFQDGGGKALPIAQKGKSVSNIDKEQIYTYSKRPNSEYTKDTSGKWLIKNESTNGKFISINDPTGSRAKILNAHAVPTNIYNINGGKWQVNNDVWTQVADNALVNNAHTRDRESAYTKGKSERLFKNITPQSYGDLALNLDRYERYQKNSGRNKNELLWYGTKDSPTGKATYSTIPRRDDMFSLYLGLPQKNKSFEPQLIYRPTNEKNSNSLYHKPTYWTEKGKQELLDSYFLRNDLNKGIYNERSTILNPVYDSLEQAGVHHSDPRVGNAVMDNPLGDFTVTEGKDKNGNYISIYDKIDFNPFQTGEGSSINPKALALKLYMKSMGYDIDGDTEGSSLLGAGKPYEIYDRIYYDEKTNKVKKYKQGGESDYYEDDLDKAQIEELRAQGYTVEELPKAQDGGDSFVPHVMYDPAGNPVMANTLEDHLRLTDMGYTQQLGGETSFEIELDDDQIQSYRDGGFTIEELPQAQDGIEKLRPQKWGFLNVGENEVVGGAGLNFPTGTGVNAIGVIPRNFDPVYKGMGSFGINQQIGNFNAGVKADIPILNDYRTGERLPYEIQPSVTTRYNIPYNSSKEKYFGKLLQLGGTHDELPEYQMAGPVSPAPNLPGRAYPNALTDPAMTQRLAEEQRMKKAQAVEQAKAYAAEQVRLKNITPAEKRASDAAFRAEQTYKPQTSETTRIDESTLSIPTQELKQYGRDVQDYTKVIEAQKQADFAKVAQAKGSGYSDVYEYEKNPPAMSAMDWALEEGKRKAEWEARSSGRAQPSDWMWTLPIGMGTGTGALQGVRSLATPVVRGLKPLAQATSKAMNTAIPGLSKIPQVGKFITPNNLFTGYSAYHAPGSIHKAIQDPSLAHMGEAALMTLGALPLLAGATNAVKSLPKLGELPQVKYFGEGVKNIRAGHANVKDLFKSQPIANFTSPEALGKYAARSEAGTLSPTSNKWFQSWQSDTPKYIGDEALAMIKPGTKASQAGIKLPNLQPVGKANVLALKRSIVPAEDIPASFFKRMKTTPKEAAEVKRLAGMPNQYQLDPAFKANPRLKELMEALPPNPNEFLLGRHPIASEFVPVTSDMIRGLQNPGAYNWGKATDAFGRGLHAWESPIGAAKILGKTHKARIAEDLTTEEDELSNKQDGGNSNNYYDAELTDEEIADLRAQGLVVVNI